MGRVSDPNGRFERPLRPELTKRPEFDSYETDREQADHISPTERVLAVLPSFLAPGGLTANT